MSEENIRMHLRAALTEIITGEVAAKERFHEEHEQYAAGSLAMILPVVEFIKILTIEVSNEVTICASEISNTCHHIHGMDKMVKLKLVVPWQPDSIIEANFATNEYYMCSGVGGYGNERKTYLSLEELTTQIVKDVGALIAKEQFSSKLTNQNNQ